MKEPMLIPSIKTNNTYQLTHLQLRRDIRELAALQLRLPENRVHIVKAVVHPALLLDVVEVDETTGVCVTVHGGQNGTSAEGQSLQFAQIVPVVGVQHTVGECLTGTDTEQVASQAGAV